MRLAAIATAAGAFSGLFGVGGGILFVPTLVALGLSQLEAEATSLVAIALVAVVGAWRQREYGNLRLRDRALIGAMVYSFARVSAVIGM